MVVLVVGIGQITTSPGPEVVAKLMRPMSLQKESYIQGGFAGLFGGIASAYFSKNGDQLDALASIAAKNHKNGAANT